jgi:hypothetical protein
MRRSASFTLSNDTLDTLDTMAKSVRLTRGQLVEYYLIRALREQVPVHLDFDGTSPVSTATPVAPQSGTGRSLTDRFANKSVGIAVEAVATPTYVPPVEDRIARMQRVAKQEAEQIAIEAEMRKEMKENDK